MDPLAQRVAARFLASLAPEAKGAVYEALKHANVHELVMGMMAEAKKVGQRFGMRDAIEAMQLWFDGGREPTTPVQLAARTYLMSDKGKRVLNRITKLIADTLKKTSGRVGYRDIGEALIAWMGE